MSRYTATRFQKGINNVSRYHTLANVPAPDQTRAHFYQDDFDQYIAAQWANTTVGAGTYALTAGDGGLLLLTTTTGATDSNYTTKTPAAFSYTSGQRSWFRTSLQPSVLTAQITAGLTAIGGGSILVPDDGMYIVSAATTGVLTAVVASGGVVQATGTIPSAAVVAATPIVLGCEYNGITGWNFYVNDKLLLSLSASTLPVATCAPSFGILNASAAAKTLRADFVQAAKERTFLDNVM